MFSDDCHGAGNAVSQTTIRGTRLLCSYENRILEMLGWCMAASLSMCTRETCTSYLLIRRVCAVPASIDFVYKPEPTNYTNQSHFIWRFSFRLLLAMFCEWKSMNVKDDWWFAENVSPKNEDSRTYNPRKQHKLARYFFSIINKLVHSNRN